jgi:prolyl oligopeptidase
MSTRSPALPLLAAATLITGGAAAQAPVPPAPVARVAPVTDRYFGEAIVDRYRWMENSEDPDWLPFMQGQNAHARAILDALPGRDPLLARIRALSGDIAVPGQVAVAGGRVFFQQRPAGSNNYLLFVQEAGKARVLIDPTKTDTANSHVSLDWWVASPDGSHIAYGLSPNGSEDSTLQVMEVASGKVLPERIPNTEAGQPSWLPDGSGFFYNELTAKVGTPERYLDSRARFHRLGTPVAADPVIMARDSDPRVHFAKIQFPIVRTAAHSGYALLTLGDVRQEFRLLIAPLAEVLAGKAQWREVADFSDEVTDYDLHRDELYLLANKGHPRGRVLVTQARAPALASAREVVPESSLVLTGLARSRDGLYLQSLDGGVSRVQRLGADGRISELALPFEGTVYGIAADPDAPGALLRLAGWLRPTGIWRIGADGRLADTGLTPLPQIDVSAYETERRFATARDGTRVPYTLIHRKGLVNDGSHPVFMSAYGSYGIAAYTPAFAGRSLALVDAGAIVGYAAVRGGGEYGRDWHRGGQLANKPNTWRDLIDVCADLVAQRYTSPAHLAIGGRSAGGITMGMALVERPELFAAVVSGVGWHNPLRYVAEQNGYTEEPEWGAISEPAGFRALRAIDSYQSVVDGTRYPATLLTTGVTDPRVAPFHPAKMAARLQAATTSGQPVLLRVDFDAGHGMGSTRAQQDAEAADTYAFILQYTRGAAAAQH